MKFVFCPLCASKLAARDLGDDKCVPFCENCNRPFFPHSGQCVIVLPVRGDKVALTRQSYGDCEKYVLTAGFVGEGETAEHAAAREVFEELGLRCEKVLYLKSYFHQKSDNLMLGFVAFIEDGDFSFSEEVRDAMWFDFAESKEKLKNATVAKLLLDEYMNFLKTHNNIP